MTHTCVSKLASIVSDNGLSPGRRQAIIWTNAGILLIVPLGTNFSGILIEIHTFSFKKMHFKMPSGKWRPFCLGLNVLTSTKTPKLRNTALPDLITTIRSNQYRDSHYKDHLIFIMGISIGLHGQTVCRTVTSKQGPFLSVPLTL